MLVRAASDLEVPVAPLHVIVLLKMVSYLDRPRERERDLEDLALTLRDGLKLGVDYPTLETASAGIDPEAAGAFLLAARLVGLTDSPSRAKVVEFMEQVRASDGRTLLRMAAASGRNADELERLWNGYAQGFQLT